MGISINKILSRSGEYALAELTHGKEALVAEVWDKSNSLKDKIGAENLFVEMNYDEIVRIKLIENFDDWDSVICQSGKNYILRGRVIQFIELENDTWIDLYLLTGADFVSIYKSQIGDLELKVDDGVEVELTKLKFFPSNS